MATGDRYLRGGVMVSLVRSAALTRAFALSSLVAPPLGVAYLAGALKASGVSTQVIDAVGEKPGQLLPLGFAKAYSIGLSQEETVAMIDERAGIIGISCMFSSSWPYDRRLVRKIRARFPNAWIVAGGEHATACADYILNTCDEVDMCARGEGEETLLHLTKVLRDGGDLAAVPGISFKRNGVVTHNPPRKRIADIDRIPPPAWELVPLENYMSAGLGHGSRNARNMPLMATRGCPYQCTFCSSPQMWTTKWAARDPVAVVDEMEQYVRLYRAENFDLYDLTMIIRKDWIVAFANEILRRRLKIAYQLPSGTRSEAIDAEVVDLIYRSGCTNLNYAPESGSPATLKRVKKRVHLPRLEASLRAACKRGLNIMVNIIIFPDDTWGDLLRTFKFMLRCSWIGVYDITFVPYVPYPGAELYNNLVKAGRLPPMSDEYFESLLIHSDLSAVRSYNPRFSTRQVLAIRLLFLSMF